MSRGDPRGRAASGGPPSPASLPTITHVVFQGLRGCPPHGQQSGICALGIDPGQAKVTHFGHILLGDEDVAGSQVPVYQLLGLQVVHALGHVPTTAERGRAQCHHMSPGAAQGDAEHRSPAQREGDGLTERTGGAAGSGQAPGPACARSSPGCPDRGGETRKDQQDGAAQRLCLPQGLQQPASIQLSPQMGILSPNLSGDGSCWPRTSWVLSPCS